MFYLAGLGLWDEKDVPIKTVDACKNADKVYCELYTAAWGGDLEKLEKIIGKKIEIVERERVEEKAEEIVEEAITKKIMLLVPGDPLVATTHVHLIMECKRKNVPFKIIHASSIYTAVAKTGLQLYKFGRTTSIPTANEKYMTSSFFDVIIKNMKMGLHTLVLLDRNMGTKEGLEIIKKVEKRKRIVKNVVLCSLLGSENETIVYGEIDDLLEKNLPPPAVIIIPGKLHFLEKEFLETLQK